MGPARLGCQQLTAGLCGTPTEPSAGLEVEELLVTAPLRLLSSDGLQRIHEASLRILERTGMLVDHERARELLEGAGAQVDHESKMVRFPPQLVEEKLALVPRQLTYHGRTPEYDRTLTPEGEIYSRVPGGATNYIDLETLRNRRAVLEDWRQFATLTDALPSIDSIATLHVGDVPAETADIHSLRVLLESQRKCIVHNAFSLRNQRFMLELMLAVRGSREALEERPLVHFMLSPISPLFLNEDDTSQLLLACEYGIPTDIPIMPIAGVTGPITLAGLIAQGNAEYLGTMTLAQVARPGHRMPYFMDPVMGDMRTGSALFGAPEVGLLVAAISQLGSELYGFPAEAIGLDSDGFEVGQSLFQKAQNMALQVMAGGKLIIGAGQVEGTMALSPVQLVIDDELMAIARRWAQGISVDDESLALDLLDEVGPRGDFLAEEHTIEHLRAGAVLETHFFERVPREMWEARGAPTIEQKAQAKAQEILASHEVPPLPDEVLRELGAVVARADRELAGT
jgi:trimethylamine--corrinoid protein Co-methyltransferase